MALNLKALLPLDHVITIAPYEESHELGTNTRPDEGAHTFCQLEKKQEEKAKHGSLVADQKRRLWIWGTY